MEIQHQLQQPVKTYCWDGIGTVLQLYNTLYVYIYILLTRQPPMALHMHFPSLCKLSLTLFGARSSKTQVTGEPLRLASDEA